MIDRGSVDLKKISHYNDRKSWNGEGVTMKHECRTTSPASYSVTIQWRLCCSANAAGEVESRLPAITFLLQTLRASFSVEATALASFSKFASMSILIL